MRIRRDLPMDEEAKEYATWAREKDMQPNISGRTKDSIPTLVGHNIVGQAVDSALRDETNTIDLDVGSWQTGAILEANLTQGKLSWVGEARPKDENRLSLIDEEIEKVNAHLFTYNAKLADINKLKAKLNKCDTYEKLENAIEDHAAKYGDDRTREMLYSIFNNHEFSDQIVHVAYAADEIQTLLEIGLDPNYTFENEFVLQEGDLNQRRLTLVERAINDKNIEVISLLAHYGLNPDIPLKRGGSSTWDNIRMTQDEAVIKAFLLSYASRLFTGEIKIPGEENKASTKEILNTALTSYPGLLDSLISASLQAGNLDNLIKLEVNREAINPFLLEFVSDLIRDPELPFEDPAEQLIDLAFSSDGLCDALIKQTCDADNMHLLMDLGLNPNYTFQDGEGLLSYIMNTDNIKSLVILINNLVNDSSISPADHKMFDGIFQTECDQGNLANLLAWKVNPNFIFTDDTSLLQYAIDNNRPEDVLLLIKSGVPNEIYLEDYLNEFANGIINDRQVISGEKKELFDMAVHNFSGACDDLIKETYKKSGLGTLTKLGINADFQFQDGDTLGKYAKDHAPPKVSQQGMFAKSKEPSPKVDVDMEPPKLK